MRATHDTSQFHVEVKHHCSAPKRYTWEIRAAHGLSVEESRDQFASWKKQIRQANNPKGGPATPEM
jgi:hypothetical protein